MSLADLLKFLFRERSVGEGDSKAGGRCLDDVFVGDFCDVGSEVSRQKMIFCRSFRHR